MDRGGRGAGEVSLENTSRREKGQNGEDFLKTIVFVNYVLNIFDNKLNKHRFIYIVSELCLPI